MTKWMKHPQLEALIEVPDAAVNGHLISGWRVTDPPPRPVLIDEEVELTPVEAPETAEPGAKYAAAVEARPDIKSELDGKEK